MLQANTRGGWPVAHRHQDLIAGELTAVRLCRHDRAAAAQAAGYSIASGGALTLLGSITVKASGGVGAVDARLSPDGRVLYVDESKPGAVGAFAVNGGNLTELASSPTALPAGAAPAGIVVT